MRNTPTTSENHSIENVLEFRLQTDDTRPRILRARGKPKDPGMYCTHNGKLKLNEDTQLITCVTCGIDISAYNALLLIAQQWDRMWSELDEWRKMRAEKAKTDKAERVRERVRELQWIEMPEADSEAQSYWKKATKALGREPYAMFRKGRMGIFSYYVLSEKSHVAWSNVDYLTTEQQEQQR